MTTYPEGVNFSLFSESASEVLLLLFDRAAAIEPVQVIRLDPTKARFSREGKMVRRSSIPRPAAAWR